MLVADPGARVGHREIAHQHQLEPAREGEPVDPGDDRLGQRFDAIEDVVEQVEEPPPADRIGRQLLHDLQIRAGAEGASRAGQGHHLDRGIALDVVADAIEVLESGLTAFIWLGRFNVTRATPPALS